MMDNFVIRFPKEVMRKFFGQNKEYRVECKRGACPVCEIRIDNMMGDNLTLDEFSAVHKIALGHNGSDFGNGRMNLHLDVSKYA